MEETEREAKVLVIGGTGLDNYLNGMQVGQTSAFGQVSVNLGVRNTVGYAFTERHVDFRVPSIVNYKGIVMAGVKLECTHSLHFSATGSLKWRDDDAPKIKPGDFVLISDGYDHTTGRENHRSFGHHNGEGLAILHTPMNPLVCDPLRNALYEALQQCDLDGTVHNGGGYVCIEGPQFSTAGMSEFYRQQHPDAAVIGMTAFPELALTREVEMHSVLVAMVTDEDNKPGHVVSDAEVREQARKSKKDVRKIVDTYFQVLGDRNVTVEGIAGDCSCDTMLENGLHSFDPSKTLALDKDLHAMFERAHKRYGGKREETGGPGDTVLEH